MYAHADRYMYICQEGRNLWTTMKEGSGRKASRVGTGCGVTELPGNHGA